MAHLEGCYPLPEKGGPGIRYLAGYYGSTGTYVMAFFYWQKSSSESKGGYYSGLHATGSLDKINSTANKIFDGYVPKGGDVTTTSADKTIVNTHCFGLNHDVTIYTKDGKSVNYKNSAGSDGGITYNS